jgi:hypothetical protein
MGHPVGNTKQFSLMKHFLCMTILLTIGKIVDPLTTFETHVLRIHCGISV